MSKNGFMVKIQYFERLLDCPKCIEDVIKKKVFNTINEAKTFILEYKTHIVRDANPDNLILENQYGYDNIIERNPNEEFECEYRFIIEEVKRPELAIDVIKNKLIEERNDLKDEEFSKLLDKLTYLAKNKGYDSAQNTLRKNKPEDDFGHIDKDNTWGEFYK